MKKTMMSLLLLAMGWLGATAQDTEDLEAKYTKDLLPVGTMAPDFAVKTVDDSAVMLSSYRAHEENGIQRPGCYVLLDFWASWCPDCRKDIPTVKKLYDKYMFKLNVVGVSFDTDKDKLKEFTQKNGMYWTMYSEYKKWKDTQISKDYHIQWLPTMYLIDPEGKVAYSTITAENMVKKLEELENDGKLTNFVTPAEFPGGSSHLHQLMSQHLKFPAIAHKYKAQATVKVSFVVGKDGHISDTEIVSYKGQPLSGKAFNALTPGEQKDAEIQVKTLFAQEALRLMTWLDANYTWTPCMERGVKQKMKYSVSIAFRER